MKIRVLHIIGIIFRGVEHCVIGIGAILMAYMLLALVIIDARLIRAVAKAEREVKISRGEAYQYPYMGSVSDGLFHRSDSACANKIGDHDLVGFGTRADAYLSKRRQCAICSP